MRQTIEAVYEQGVFRIISPIGMAIPDGHIVHIVIDTPASPDEILDSASQVYNGFNEDQIEEIEQIARDRSSFFTERAE
jgi:predicted DNA-binding antitoxin AbrB/MazE fold protein